MGRSTAHLQAFERLGAGDFMDEVSVTHAIASETEKY